MQGSVISISTFGEVEETKTTNPNILPLLKKIVGGYIEVVPFFSHFIYNGEPKRCVVFCNEEGKLEGLPINELATHFWFENLGGRKLDDVLVGNIAVVLGDDEFLASI